VFDYGRFLSISTTSMVPITIIITAMMAIPNMRSDVVAKLDAGAAVGTGVAAGSLA